MTHHDPITIAAASLTFLGLTWLAMRRAYTGVTSEPCATVTTVGTCGRPGTRVQGRVVCGRHLQDGAW